MLRKDYAKHGKTWLLPSCSNYLTAVMQQWYFSMDTVLEAVIVVFGSRYWHYLIQWGCSTLISVQKSTKIQH